MSSVPTNLRGTCPGCVVNSIIILLVFLVNHCCYVAAIVEVCVAVFLLSGCTRLLTATSSCSTIDIILHYDSDCRDTTNSRSTTTAVHPPAHSSVN